MLETFRNSGCWNAGGRSSIWRFSPYKAFGNFQNSLDKISNISLKQTRIQNLSQTNKPLEIGPQRTPNSLPKRILKTVTNKEAQKYSRNWHMRNSNFKGSEKILRIGYLKIPNKNSSKFYYQTNNFFLTE